MGMIWNSLQTVYAVLALIPILPFVIVYFVYGVFTEDRKKALRMAMDISTAFFIPCVAVLFDMMFNSGFGLYGILLVMLLALGLLGNAQFRKRGAVDMKRIFKAVWRLTFFGTSVLYIIFMIILLGRILFTVA